MATDISVFPDVVDDVIEYTRRSKNTVRLIRYLRKRQAAGEGIDVRLVALLADILDGTVPAKLKKATRDWDAYVYKDIVAMFARALDSDDRRLSEPVLAEARRLGLPVHTKGQRTSVAKRIAADVLELTPRQLRERIERPASRGKRG